MIAAAVQSKVAEHESNTVWIIAQSNVAVKNVAEKLAESGFLDFKLLVSEDFHFDWYVLPAVRFPLVDPDPRHEHLYQLMGERMIDSGNFGGTAHENRRILLGARVLLCTTGMLSTPRLMNCGFMEIVPVQTIIIDEASQIEVGDYLPILARYKTTLRKMVFIGDDKQCKRRRWGG